MNTILLRNLIKIRWIAILGQLSAIFFVTFVIKIEIPFFEALIIILFSVALNFYSYLEERINKTISNIKAFLFLLFDTLQLGILLFLTGGIVNPFSILILAPVITSASYLPALLTVILSSISIIIIIVLNFYFVPLNLGNQFVLPTIYNFGVVTSLIITVIFIAIYAYLFASSSRNISNALAVSKLQILNQKKITEIGSLSAATAHELGTPLNTIFLILNDLIRDKKLNEDKNILKDIKLLKSQAERCRKILKKLSQNPLKLKDKFLEKVKISDLIKINFDKFNKNKKLNLIEINEENQIEIIFKDEIMYALGNIIQNAIFHSTKFVIVELNYLKKNLIIKISDDGNGFAKDIIDKLGEPYISKNNRGMGLGIFISKNLIENMGGKISFYNSKQSHAIVEINFDNSILNV
ncbi:MAG: ActS/PrrB/RegB family redox-sensitive histidine kinase [Alphaproteobacteria bacterium]